MKASRVPEEWKRKKGAKCIQYGTAGFREKSEDLSHVMFRMGLLAGLRAADTGKAVGVMITASHNPECDNGVKIIDPMGNMLHISYERLATDLVNQIDEDLENFVQRILKEKHIDLSSGCGNAKVLCAYDTRESSPKFHEAVKCGVQLMNLSFETCGVLTTPQLHYVVRCTNDPSYGTPTVEGYFNKLISAFKSLNEGVVVDRYVPKLMVDAANGVGGLHLQSVQKILSPSLLDIVVLNSGQGMLNHQCGADFVKIHQQPPTIWGETVIPRPGERWASFDGDGDRLIYFHVDECGRFRMLDGDKICVLLVGYLKDLLEKAGIDIIPAVVQTAYANGRSTSFAQKILKVFVSCVNTGVKNLHLEAEKHSIGVYFEANGHGTVLFNEDFLDALSRRRNQSRLSVANKRAVEQLEFFVKLVNETVGDAISDMLVVESILRLRNWSHLDWDQLYEDLPQRQLKIAVKDRWSVETTDAERKVVKPVGLQEEIDSLVKQFGLEARCFVRPSGTENIVRIYAEATTQENADLLAESVSAVVTKMCN